MSHSCSVLMCLWTFLKGESYDMLLLSYLPSCTTWTYLHLWLCPSVSKSRGSWVLWNRTTGVHLPTCIRVTQSSSSRMLHRPETALPCACTSLRMLVWPIHFWFPVTSQKHFCLCTMNIALMVCSAALDYIPSG